MIPTVISSRPLENAIRDHIERHDLAGLRELLSAQRAPDIADVLDRLPASERDLAFAQLAPLLAAGVLAEADIETKRSLVKQLSRVQINQLLDHLPADDAARLLTDVPEDRDQLLTDMNPALSQEVRQLLQYPRHSAGRLMTEKFVRVTPTMTAAEALKHMREINKDVETFSDAYVLDQNGKLAGVASLRDIILAPPHKPLREFMTTRVISVAPTDDQEIAAQLVAHYNFMALPVVQDDRLLGIITVDDIIDVLIEEGTEDQLRFGGVEPGIINQPYFTTPVWRVVRSRVGWLVLLFVAETATGTVLRFFEDELAKVVALSFFIPLLIGTGGNTGAQTVSTIIRGLALKEIRLRDTIRVVIREFGSGLLLGLLLGVIAFGRAMLWGSGVQLSLVVALAIIAICVWANTIGSLIPLLAQRFRVDPALVSAPLITTLVDATGLAIYLLIAKLLLSALA